MEQFSHDLTVALEETSKSGGVRTGCWGVRRRTRSTGNLPCAPQPTEDSSSSPADGPSNNNCAGGGGGDAILSDSDDRQELKLSLNARQSCMFGNFESDSLNETTFSPARPNTRRKRKFKRMAVEYETTPSTPGTTSMAGAFALHNADGVHGAASDANVNSVVVSAAAAAAAAAAVASSSSAVVASAVNYGTASTSAAVPVASTSHCAASAASTAVTAVASTSFDANAAGCSSGGVGATFGASALLKKRPLKQYHHVAGQENFRANLFFCGKRKRSHRDRYYEQHSSSVPRQRDHLLYNAKNSYTEYRSRNRSFSSAGGPKACGERIAPLNNSIVSKIERIAQDTRSKQRGGIGVGCVSTLTSGIGGIDVGDGTASGAFRFNEAATAIPTTSIFAAERPLGGPIAGVFTANAGGIHEQHPRTHRIGFNATSDGMHKPTTFGGLANLHLSGLAAAASATGPPRFAAELHQHHQHHHHQHQHHLSHHQHPQHQPHHQPHHQKLHKDQQQQQHHHHHTRKMQRRTKRQQLKMRLQFDDPNAMDAMHMSDMVSSSSMSSSSDSEAAQRNDTDREGDDELTDWPGNEAMVNFASKNDFKRAKPRCAKAAMGAAGTTMPLPFIKSEEPTADDDTLMSADEMFAGASGGSPAAAAPPTTLNLISKYSPGAPAVVAAGGVLTQPITIQGAAQQLLQQQHQQDVESEMSGETSTNFLSSPGSAAFEVREIRAGCRRIRNERPGFTILTSVNEDLSKFLQDARKEQLKLPDTDANEHEKLVHLANLYSLSMHGENGYVILTKTSNTMQSVKIDRSNSSMSKRFLSDYKRRCYGGDEDPESSGMAS